MRLSTLLSLSLVASTAFASDISFVPRPVATPPPQPYTDTIQFTNSNHAVLKDVIRGQNVSKTMINLGLLKTSQPILFIDSPGGSIDAGMNLVNAILSSPKNITCVAYFAASMAFVTFQACHKRCILNNSTLMQHQAHFGAEGNEENFKSYTKYIFSMLDKINGAQAERMKMSLANFNKARESDMWMYGNDAFQYNAADKLVSAVCTEDLLIESKIEVENTIFGPIKLVYSKCPLMTDPVDIDFMSVYDTDKQQRIYDFYMGPNSVHRRDPIPLGKTESTYIMQPLSPTPTPESYGRYGR